MLLTLLRPKFRGYMARKIPSVLASTYDPDDLVQETYVDVFRRIESFDNRGESSFERWVLTIAQNKLRNHLRDRRAQKRGGRQSDLLPDNYLDSSVALFDQLAGPQSTPSRAFSRKEIVAAVEDALRALPEHCRNAIRLIHFEGKTVRDTAHNLGRSERAVHGLCRRGMKQLREYLHSESRFLSSND